MQLNQWVRDALDYAKMPGAELARRLSEKLNRQIDRAAVNKMTIVLPAAGGKARGTKPKGATKPRAVGADEMLAIAEITGYPLPSEGTAAGRVTQMIEPETRAGAGGGGIQFRNDQADAGGGLSISQDAIRDRWLVPTAFVRGELHIKGDAAVIEVYGDSGYDPGDPGAPGSLFPGDRVIVDMGDTTPSPPGPFLLFDGMTVVVKLVELVTGSSDPARIRLSSRNPRYQAAEVTEDEARIIGRVRGRISAL